MEGFAFFTLMGCWAWLVKVMIMECWVLSWEGGVHWEQCLDMIYCTWIRSWSGSIPLVFLALHCGQNLGTLEDLGDMVWEFWDLEFIVTSSSHVLKRRFLVNIGVLTLHSHQENSNSTNSSSQVFHQWNLTAAPHETQRTPLVKAEIPNRRQLPTDPNKRLRPRCKGKWAGKVKGGKVWSKSIMWGIKRHEVKRKSDDADNADCDDMATMSKGVGLMHGKTASKRNRWGGCDWWLEPLPSFS